MNIAKAVIKTGRKMVRPVVKACQKVKANKPEIFVISGVVLTVGSFVWVAVEAMKAPEVMTETSDKVKDIEDHYAAEREGEHTEKELKALAKQEKKELRGARADGIIAMIRLFGGPVLLLAVGSGLTIKGYNVFRARNAMLGAALKGTEKMFQFYRDNVIEAEGKEADERYMRGIVGETEVTTTVKDENGNEVTKTEKVPIIRKGNPWQFEFSPEYFRMASGIPEVDLLKLQDVEDYFKWQYDGNKKYSDISMFEVLEYLHANWDAIDPTGERKIFARQYGWGHDAKGDPQIDLGVYRAINDPARTGQGEKVFIEMNCDGRLETLKNKYKARYIEK